MSNLTKIIGILRENKSHFERRVALTPSHCRTLIQQGIRILVQPSSLRCYTNKEFIQAGAEVTEDLSRADVILGIKEVPIANLIENKTYVYFAHVIKAQPYNMPLLDAILEKNIRHLDYEMIRDTTPSRERLVAFGIFAGNAGIIDFLQGLGQYLMMRRYSTPFIYQAFSYMYENLEQAINATSIVGNHIKEVGLPEEVVPLVFGVTGTGRVAQGAVEILEHLPNIKLTPQQLATYEFGEEMHNTIYIVMFGSQDCYERKDGGEYTRGDFHANASQYKSVFAEKYLSKLSVIVHCMFWNQHMDHLVSIKDVQTEDHKLFGVCDISCDLNGGIEFCHKFTEPNHPFFLYDPNNDTCHDFLEEHSHKTILYHSVDFLPSELPKDASEYFGNRLTPLLPELLNIDPTQEFSQLQLRQELKDAFITWNGKLCPEYEYIESLRRQNN